MASNFRIDSRKNQKTLHIHLQGDFDGDSAVRLINTIEEMSNDISRVLIHAGRIERIYPFGQAILDSRLKRVKRLIKECRVVGMKSDQLNIS